MNVFLCLDDKNGMCFGGRRQSRDMVLRQKMLELCEGSRLYMNNYSAKLFGEEERERISVSENFLEETGKGDFCFCETAVPNMAEVEKIYLFRWNRIYPSDLKFTEDINAFKLVMTEEFSGSSHEKISLFVYEK